MNATEVKVHFGLGNAQLTSVNDRIGTTWLSMFEHR
jgi:hypothetical protein